MAKSGEIQLYKIFKGTQSPIIPTLVLTVALLYACIYGYNIRRVLGLKHIPVLQSNNNPLGDRSVISVLGMSSLLVNNNNNDDG